MPSLRSQYLENPHQFKISDTSYSDDSERTAKNSDAGSINTDSALSSMHNSDDAERDYTRYKTIKKKRLPDWWQGKQLEQQDIYCKDLEAHSNNLDLSCDDEAPFGNSEYIRKIRAKNAKMASLDPNLSSKMYRSASTRRRTQLGASCQNLQPPTTRLKRSQSLKTVETLV